MNIRDIIATTFGADFQSEFFGLLHGIFVAFPLGGTVVNGLALATIIAGILLVTASFSGGFGKAEQAWDLTDPRNH